MLGPKLFTVEQKKQVLDELLEFEKDLETASTTIDEKCRLITDETDNFEDELWQVLGVYSDQIKKYRAIITFEQGCYTMFDPSISEMVTTKSFDEDNVKTAMMLIDLYFEFIDRTQKKMNDALSRTSATMNSLENLTIIESPFEQEQKARAVLYFFDKAGTIKRVKVNFKQARSSVSELYPLIPGSLFEEFPFNLSETAIAHLQNEAADLNSNVYVVYSLSDEITIDSMIPKVLDNLQVSYTPKPRKTKPPVKYILIGDDCTKSPLYWLNKSGNPLQGWFFGNDTIPYAVIDELFDIISEHCKKRYKNDRKRVLAPLSPPTLPATDDKKLN